MDSAKNKKLFPELTPLSPAEAAVRAQVRSARFSMSASFWETLERDAEVKAEFEARVELRARQIVESENGPQKMELYAKARGEGFEKGLAEGRERGAALCASLEKASQVFQQEREALLHRHEALWCQALMHLMRRFLVPLSPERLAGLENWMREAIGELGKETKFRVALAPSVVSRLRSANMPTPSQWEWVEDAALPETDLRVELDGGGILFSQSAEVAKLESKMSELLG